MGPSPRVTHAQSQTAIAVTSARKRKLPLHVGQL